MSEMTEEQLKNIVEAALLAAGRPLTLDHLLRLFGEENPPERQALRKVLTTLMEEYADRGIELKEVASGFRIQVREELAPWLHRLDEERPPRYSRALLETLALIAYRQPITRGEIEDVRGVSVSSNIIRTLLEREWIRVVGHRDVPGRPAMYGTTRQFLDYFNLKGLDELPTLAELRDLDSIDADLELEIPLAEGEKDAAGEEGREGEEGSGSPVPEAEGGTGGTPEEAPDEPAAVVEASTGVVPVEGEGGPPPEDSRDGT